MSIHLPSDIKNAIRNKYAWPGGYPLYLIMADGGELCIDCAKKNYRALVNAHVLCFNCEWRPVVVQINWEDPMLWCLHCAVRIPSAYAEDDPLSEGETLSRADDQLERESDR